MLHAKCREMPPRAHEEGQRDCQSEQSDAKPSSPRHRIDATFAYAAPNDIAVDRAPALKREIGVTCGGASVEERDDGNVEGGGYECRDGSEEEETLQQPMRAGGELKHVLFCRTRKIE